jgi:hypothetical protein
MANGRKKASPTFIRRLVVCVEPMDGHFLGGGEYDFSGLS